MKFEGPNGLTTGNFFATASYLGNGLYQSQYVPFKSGQYVLSITLLGEHILDSPFYVTVYPGEVSAADTTTNLGVAPIYSVAGMTKFFSLITYDMY